MRDLAFAAFGGFDCRCQNSKAPFWMHDAKGLEFRV